MYRDDARGVCARLADTHGLMNPGDQIGPYEILSLLGAGGMGEVYRARDTRLGREVALKVLPAEVANDPVRRLRFEMEARAVAALNHPNIVNVYDVGDGYMVSELVEGRPVGTEELGLRRTLEVAAEIAGGLAAAHDAGIVHRDLKPDNILLTRDGRPKILDFGLAKVEPVRLAPEDATATMRTLPGMTIGTPGYMSPEQVRGLSTDSRSDIFSFGLILYELLAGRRAFQGGSSIETMAAILRLEPQEMPEKVPPALQQIVVHCLEKDPRERFQSARDLRFALLQAATPSSTHAAVEAEAPPRAKRRMWYGLAALALALVAATAGATRWLGRAPAAAQWSGVLLGGPQMALNPRLSPDGNLLAFRALDNALTQVAVMKPESGNWSVLTHARDRGAVDQVSWAPDGSAIYYDRTTDVPHGVYRVPVLGGEEHLLLEDANSPEVLPDGSLLVTRLNAQGAPQVYRFWQETGRMQELPLERPLHSAPACARVGKEAITYGSPLGAGGQNPGLYEIDLATNGVRRLGVPQAQTSALRAWTVTRDGKSLLLALPAGSITRMVALPVSGQGDAKTLFTVISPVWYVEAGRDGSLFVNPVERSKELMRLAPGSGASERIVTFPLGGATDQAIVLPDGRAVAPSAALGKVRLMAAESGKELVPLINTQEAANAPMTAAGAREIAFLIGPAAQGTIALADTVTGRVTRRIAPGKGMIRALSASPKGDTLYFCAGGTVWSVPSAGGEARAVANGEYAAADPAGGSLIVVRGESSHIRLFRVRLDGGGEKEIPVDRTIPLYGIHGGFFSSGSIDAKGRLLVSLSPLDSWFNALGILATDTGHIERVPTDRASDHHTGVWTRDGRITYTQVSMRANLWRFVPDKK